MLIIHLVKSVKLQIRALCMLGKEEWVKFIISVSTGYNYN